MQTLKIYISIERRKKSSMQRKAISSFFFVCMDKKKMFLVFLAHSIYTRYSYGYFICIHPHFYNNIYVYI